MLCRLLIVFCLAPLLLAAQAHSQTDEVHIFPPNRPALPTPGAKPASVGGELAFSGQGKPLRVNVNLVLVPVTVTDPRNRLVTGLERKDFLLYESQEQQRIRYFSAEDAPISIGVLLDLSKSMRNKIDDAREALREFFRTANPQDEYFVITFSDRPEVLAETTQSIGYIQGRLATVVPSGHTALLDAIYLGLGKMRSARYGRRALLIISDGGDNHSRYRAAEIRRRVQEADVELYAIGIFDGIFKTPEEWAGKRLLTQITEATGGRTITLNNPRQLPQIAATISLELRNQYVLGYEPSRAALDGQWRKIQVRLTPSRDPDLRVHFRRGYFAPGE